MRETIKLPLLEFINKEPDLQQFKNTEIELYADLENWEKILEVIESNNKKFIIILFIYYQEIIHKKFMVKKIFRNKQVMLLQ